RYGRGLVYVSAPVAEVLVGVFVAPGVVAAVVSLAGSLPLLLGWQGDLTAADFGEPAAKGEGFVPGDADHGVVGLVPGVVVPEARFGPAFSFTPPPALVAPPGAVGVTAGF